MVINLETLSTRQLVLPMQEKYMITTTLLYVTWLIKNLVAIYNLTIYKPKLRLKSTIFLYLRNGYQTQENKAADFKKELQGQVNKSTAFVPVGKALSLCSFWIQRFDKIEATM